VAARAATLLVVPAVAQALTLLVRVVAQALTPQAVALPVVPVVPPGLIAKQVVPDAVALPVVPVLPQGVALRIPVAAQAPILLAVALLIRVVPQAVALLAVALLVVALQAVALLIPVVPRVVHYRRCRLKSRRARGAEAARPRPSPLPHLRRTPSWRRAAYPRSRRRRTAGEGMPISSGIMFLMYRLERLAALVHIRQPLQHRGGLCGVSGEGDSRGIGVGLCRILHLNFRECPKGEVR
jgi:hypothetical protein